MQRPEEIISDAEVTRVHGYANFGSMSPREVVNDGVRKTAVGYHCGHTQFSILRDHGLVTRPRLGSYDVDLTKKGKAYGRAIYTHPAPPSAQPAEEGALREALEEGLRYTVGLLPGLAGAYDRPDNTVYTVMATKGEILQARKYLAATRPQDDEVAK